MNKMLALMPLTLWSGSALAINMISVGYSGGNQASGDAFSAGELEGSWAHISEADFNAISLTELVSYDVVLVQWNSSATLDIGWETKMSTYVESGGALWLEDPNNVDDLGPLASSAGLGCSPGVLVAEIEGLTDGITDNFVNCHIVFDSWDDTILSPVLQDGANTTMLAGEYGSGRVILSGPDHDYHASKTGGVEAANQYNFVLNIVNWLGAEGDDCVPVTWYADADGDGYGDAATTVSECTAPAGYISDASDCDDTDPLSWASTMWYDDFDGDGYGDPDEFYAIEACSMPAGYTSADLALDCNDLDASINPDALETCDGVDNDCDGRIDPPDSEGSSLFYADADGDGYGNAADTTSRCSEGDGYVSDASDCDDTTAAVYPGADEVCDGLDNDCDAVADPDDSVDATTWYADADADGYGDPATGVTSCTAPDGLIADWSDCDDADAAINPDAVELCDGADNNCDGSVDGPDSEDATLWYADEDGDGYGFDDAEEVCEEVEAECDTGADDTGACVEEICEVISSAVTSCAAPDGYVDDNTDCDDADADLYPGAPGFDDECLAVEDTGEPVADDTGEPADDTGDADDDPVDGDEDTGDAGTDEDEDGDDGKVDVESCGCATGSLAASSPWVALVGLLGLARRRAD